MQRFLRHYVVKMPAYLVRQAERTGFDPEAFISWYISFPDIKTPPLRKKSSRFKKYLQYYGYYFWALYGVSALLTLLVAPILGIVALLISPFIVAGAIYALLFAVWHLRLLKILEPQVAKKQPKRPHKNKKTTVAR